MSKNHNYTGEQHAVSGNLSGDRIDRSRKIRLGAYAACLAGLTGVAAVASGISPTEIASYLPPLNGAITPDVPAYGEITRGMISANDALRSGSLAVAGGALVATGAAYAASLKNSRLWHMKHLAAAEHSGRLEARKKMRRYRIPLGISKLAVASVALAAATSGIEHEVATGPERAVNQAVSVLSPDNENPHLLVQDTETMFMNSSYVPQSAIDALADIASGYEGVTVRPFSRELVDVKVEADNKTGLVLGLPDDRFSEVIGQSLDGNFDCSAPPVIADKAVGASKGDTIYLNGQSATVIGTSEGASSMNRVNVVAPNKVVTDCLQKQTGDSKTYYGAVIDGAQEVVDQMLAEDGVVQEGVVITADEMRENNRRFWQANGTPILLQMMGYILGFGYIANRNEHQASLERRRKELGMMRSLGVSIRDLKAVEGIRALRESTMAAAIGSPLAVGLAAAVNAAEHGIRVGIGVREIAVGFTVTFAAKLLGSFRALNKFAKTSTPRDAMKGA